LSQGETSMRLSHIAIIGLVAFTLKGKVGSAQEHKPDQPAKLITPFTLSLFSADALLRSLDGYTTVKNLGNSCACVHETNPMAPHSASVGKQILFQSSALAATYGTAWLLNHYHHPKLARVILMIDVANEARSVVGNYRVDTSANYVTGKQLSNK